MMIGLKINVAPGVLQWASLKKKSQTQVLTTHHLMHAGLLRRQRRPNIRHLITAIFETHLERVYVISTKHAGKDETLTFIAALLSNFHSLLISLFDKAIKHRSIFNFGVSDVWCIQMHVK